MARVSVSTGAGITKHPLFKPLIIGIIILLLYFLFIKPQAANIVQGITDIGVTPTPEDNVNAANIYNALKGWSGTGWSEDDEGAVQVVELYTKDTYPRLRKAVSTLYGENLTKWLKDDIDDDLMPRIVNIIS